MSKAYLSLVLSLFCFSAQAADRFVEIAAKDKFERSRIAEHVSIDSVRSGSVWAYVDHQTLAELKQAGFRILGSLDADLAISAEARAFPPADSRFHTYAETEAALRGLQARHADIAKVHSLGKSIENRQIWALQINSTPEALQSGVSGKPGAAFLGAHHGREHLSVEIPLMLGEYLLEHRDEPEVGKLIETRDIWIAPMINPDGTEFDISTGKYQQWRKNRRPNDDGSFGVDLNRNFGYLWGKGGSSKLPRSDIYMGEEPFSEPETRAVRDFINARPNIRTLLSFHTFSELILYPWGHSHNPITNTADQEAFVAMAKAMAAWNGYKPQQSSDLYITTGDTTDWAYAERGIFAFTFELSPKTLSGGGFYPGASVIDKVFSDNLKPCLYLIELADDPHRAAEKQPQRWLRNYVEPRAVDVLGMPADRRLQ